MSGELQAQMAALSKRCYRDQMTDGPWDLDGAWAITADGHIALAVERSAIAAELTEPTANIGGKVRDWIAMPTSPIPLSRSALFAFVDMGRVCGCGGTKLEPCDKCNGIGGEVDCECAHCGHQHTYECECDHGKVACSECSRRRIGCILGKKINTRLIADVLRIVADERDIDGAVVNIGSTNAKRRSKANECLVLRPHGDGPQWVAFIMPMVDDVEAVCAYTEPPQ